MTDIAVALPPPAERGRLDIHDDVVATIARKAAASVSLTRRASGLSRITSSDLPSAKVTVAAGHVHASLVVAAPWPTSASALARRVQDAVIQQVGDYTGLTVTRVDVDVHCVAPEDQPTDRRVQ